MCSWSIEVCVFSVWGYVLLCGDMCCYVKVYVVAVWRYCVNESAAWTFCLLLTDVPTSIMAWEYYNVSTKSYICSSIFLVSEGDIIIVCNLQWNAHTLYTRFLTWLQIVDWLCQNAALTVSMAEILFILEFMQVYVYLSIYPSLAGCN